MYNKKNWLITNNCFHFLFTFRILAHYEQREWWWCLFLWSYFVSKERRLWRYSQELKRNCNYMHFWELDSLSLSLSIWIHCLAQKGKEWPDQSMKMRDIFFITTYYQFHSTYFKYANFFWPICRCGQGNQDLMYIPMIDVQNKK